MCAWAQRSARLPELRFVKHYHDDPGYIAALAAAGARALAARTAAADMLVLSFHGVPERTLQLGDPYHCECHEDGAAAGRAAGAGARTSCCVTFQSRFGKAQWLRALHRADAAAAGAQGVERVDVICPGFVADCLETLEEIDQEARAAFLAAGGKAFHYIACLNDQHEWIAALAGIALRHLQGWDPSSPPADAELAGAARARAAPGRRRLTLDAAITSTRVSRRRLGGKAARQRTRRHEAATRQAESRHGCR